MCDRDLRMAVTRGYIYIKASTAYVAGVKTRS